MQILLLPVVHLQIDFRVYPVNFLLYYAKEHPPKRKKKVREWFMIHVLLVWSIDERICWEKVAQIPRFKNLERPIIFFLIFPH